MYKKEMLLGYLFINDNESELKLLIMNGKHLSINF